MSRRRDQRWSCAALLAFSASASVALAQEHAAHHGMASTYEERFDRGRNVLNKVWVIAPSEDTLHDGLGPLFNQRSCIACHPDNGRGSASISALVRLSVRANGKIVPHPIYGEQLNERGIPGVPEEGRAEIHYTLRTVTLSDGTKIELRQPHLTFRDLHYGPIGSRTMTSLRIAPAIVGLGLLELVPEAQLLEYADPDDANHDGISGRPNVGRFGWKATSPDLLAQITSAFREDMGLTTRLTPTTNCTRAETACLEAASGGDPEIADFMLENLMTYLMHIAPPEPREVREGLTYSPPAALPSEKINDDFSLLKPVNQRFLGGAELFRALGCAACHRETLTTGTSASYPELSQRQFHPYTDLLLHDMGPGLADGRPDREASGSEWRTAPLWGIGRAQQADPDVTFLHDGRARTLNEAILWHDGEARSARDRFARLNASERASLLAFIDSL